MIIMRTAPPAVQAPATTPTSTEADRERVEPAALAVGNAGSALVAGSREEEEIPVEPVAAEVTLEVGVGVGSEDSELEESDSVGLRNQMELSNSASRARDMT